MNWREQALSTTREVRRVYLAADNSRFCVKVIRVEDRVELVVSDAESVTDAEVAAGKLPTEVLRGCIGDVMFDLGRGNNPYRISREEISVVEQATRDALDEVKLRAELFAKDAKRCVP